MLQNGKVVKTKTCKHCGANFDITDKDLEFYEKVSPVFPNPVVSFSTHGLKQPFHPREKGVKEDIPINGGETKEGAVVPAKTGIYENEKKPSNDSESEGHFSEQRPVSLKETGLNGERSPDSFFEFGLGLKDLGNGKIKYLIPPPTLCPDCRQQRRLSFRNERKLYKRKCDFNGKDIISIYSPDKPYKVYHQDFWWGDKWDALDYGYDFDFNKSFFEQFEELIKKVPRVGLHVLGNENSEFVNQCGYSKSCYLSYNTDFSENCIYCNNAFKCTNCIDIFNADNCENCYNSIDIKNCFHGFFLQDCKDSSYINNSYNLDSCNNCFACINLQNKQYHILNKEYSKEEYFEKIKYYSQNMQELFNNFNQLKKKLPHLYANIKNSENVLGNNLMNVKNAYHCFDCFSDENIAYCSIMSNAKNFYDFDVGGYYSELHYEVISSGDNNLSCCFDTNIWGNSSNIYYSDVIIGCHNCFGCIGLKNKSYCILNKQYTKEEYEILVPKIISHMSSPYPSPAGEGVREWGEFFPSSLSPFGYNETVAQEYYPLTRDEVISFCHSELDSESLENKSFNQKKDPEINSGGQLIHGPIFNWSTYEAPFPKVDKIIPANKLPENIADIPDDILNWAIECEVTKKPFRIIKEELAFYRKHNLPIPRKHPDQRHLDRMSLRNPRKLFERKCDKCGIDIQTTYAPQRKEIVYCEECYNKEIY